MTSDVKAGVKGHTGNLSNLDTLGTEEASLVMRCPDFRGCNFHKQGVCKCVLLIVHILVVG